MIPFISSEDLSSFMGQEVDPSDHLVAIVLDSACEQVRSYLEQVINLTEDDVETQDGTGREALLLRQLPVIVVSVVTEDDVELVEGTDWIRSRGILYRTSSSFPLGWALGRGNIVITYDHGWAIDEDSISTEDPVIDRVPSDIRIVALGLAARTYRGSTLSTPFTETGIVTSETIGDYSYTQDTSNSTAVIELTTGTTLLDDEKAILDHYKPGNL